MIKCGVYHATAVFLFLVLASTSLPAQQSKPPIPDEAPVAPEGTQVATEQTPSAATNSDALRKATQNPVASLISVPVQSNSNFGVNPGNRTQNVLNIQPVVPVDLSRNWNLIIRWITPIVWQPLPNQPSTPETGVYGLGDMQPTFFLVPKNTGKLIWGGGPILQLPTATNKALGQGKLGIGPSVVLLTQPGPWTIGALANNVWSVAGAGGRPVVNQFLLQYFINYNLKKGWYLTTAPILTANWRASNGNTWTVPFGGGAGRIMKLGFQPVNLSATFYGNGVYPTGTSSWNMRLQIAFLFPKLTKEQEMMMMQQRLNQMKQQQAKPK
jgi:hypothetical protein